MWNRFHIQYGSGIFFQPGNFGEMDWIDIAVSTVNPLKKYRYRNFGTELMKSNTNFSTNSGFRPIFNDNKSMNDFLLEFPIGHLNALKNELLNSLGGENVSRNFLVDIVSGTTVNEGKKILERLRQSGFTQQAKSNP